MARKVKFDFTPSEYQDKIFDWVQHGVGNAIIQARSGSGKTTTAVASMKLIPKTEKCLFIAFNKSIADELNERLKTRQNCTSRTTHSLGYLMVKRNLGSNITLDEYKYRNYLKTNIGELTTTNGEIKTRQQIEEYLDNITMLIDYARFNLAQSEREINEIAQKYSIPVTFDECVVTQKCLEWGKENVDTIDYTDMIWLPVELSLKPIGLTYDWVYIDEAQDLSLCSTKLFLKCIKRGGRFVAILDDLQSINGFAGASEESFDFLKNYPNTTLFKLPVSYRCAKKIINYANGLVPDILAREDAPEGIIADNCHVKDIQEGDMVLCRSKAPLVNLYVKLLHKNINCYIKGQDIGTNLINELEKINMDKVTTDLDNDSVFVRLYDKMFSERNKLMQTRGLDYDDATLSSFIMEKYDEINALSILAEKCKTKEELIEHIKNVFKEDSEGVCLSTVHKAKGLESENVYIICHSSMPSKLATKEWEKQQELNIMYVAYTRAKNKLGFISEKEVKPSFSMQDPNTILNELGYVERKVCAITGKEPMTNMQNSELLRFKLQNIKHIEDLHKDDNVVEMKTTIEKKQNKKDLLSDLETMLA